MTNQGDHSTHSINTLRLSTEDIVNTLLHYLRAVDPTLVTALSIIASQRESAMKKLEEACHLLLDYVAMHPNVAVRFMASDMILTVHSDALYLSKNNARSQAAGHF
eukprot:9456480-Ditylum_brightwellii.AAC.1